MSSFVVLYLFAILCGCAYGVSNSNATHSRDNHTGKDAALGQFPHQAILRTKSSRKHFCSGAIIGRRFVLTAAHCFNGVDVRGIQVVVGTIYTSSGGDVYEVDRVSVHNLFNATKLLNDIAVVRTTVDIRQNQNVQYAQLAARHTNLRSNAFVSGWNSYKSPVNPNQPGFRPTRLQYRPTNVSEKADCVRMNGAYGHLIHDGNVCTRNAINVGVCTADSGGPLVVTVNQRQRFLIGVLSWNSLCIAGRPDVFTYVVPLLTWINAQMRR